MQAKSKLPNGYNVIRHRISTQFPEQREARGKPGKSYGYNPGKVYLQAEVFSERFFLKYQAGLVGCFGIALLHNAMQRCISFYVQLDLKDGLLSKK